MIKGSQSIARLEANEHHANGTVTSIVQAQTSGLSLLSDDDAEALAAGLDRSDLSNLSLEELAEQARWHKEQADYHHDRMLACFIEMGRRLLEAKSRLKHGEFAPYVVDEVGITREHAWKLMQVSRNVARVQHLPPDTSLRGALDTIKEQKQAERVEQRKLAPPIQVVPDITLGTAKIELADCCDLPMPDGMVDLIVTSPPYGLGIDYANTDDDEGYSTYLEHVEAWVKELHRVAGENGRICLNVPLDVTYGGTHPIYADWVYALQEAGWQYRSTIIWNEDNVSKSTARGSVDSPSAPHVIARVETIIVMHKGEWNLHRGDEHDLSHDDWLDWTNGLWQFPGEYRSDHPAPFPEELPRRCIALFSFKNDVILDPFLGSGTTAAVAARMGRTVYGFDRSEQYIAAARLRVAKVQHAD